MWKWQKRSLHGADTIVHKIREITNYAFVNKNVLIDKNTALLQLIMSNIFTLFFYIVGNL